MKPRVLFVVPDLAAGGAQPMNVRLAKHLQRRGWEVGLAVLFRRDEVISPGALAGFEVHRLGATGWRAKSVALARLARLAKCYDLVVGGMEFAATNYGYIAARMAKKPFLSWTHSAFERLKDIYTPIDCAISLWVYRHQQCRYVVFPSHGSRISLANMLGGSFRGAHWKVIENFLESDVSTIEETPPDPNIYAKPVLIGIGRLAEEKAFDHLIRAHAQIRDSGIDHNLLLIGEGPLRDELQAEAYANGVADSTFMPGRVPDLTAWLRCSTVFALSSRCEGFSLVLAEALAAGVPAVAMDCPAGPREILQDGRYGLLVPDGDEVAMTEAISRFLRDPDLRAHYAELGKERAKHYSAERIVPQWEALFEQIIEEHRRGSG